MMKSILSSENRHTDDYDDDGGGREKKIYWVGRILVVTHTHTQLDLGNDKKKQFFSNFFYTKKITLTHFFTV